MHQTVTSAVWERRTNKVIAGAVTIIGLTMMISGLEQCIYIGLVFVVSSLGWLAWVTVREKKAEPPRPDQPTPPVLLLVSSQHLMQLREQQQRGNISDPEDKPPSYDQILKLDGLPPDYSLIAEKPPRYEDLRLDCVDCVWGAAAPLPPDDTTIELPLVHGLNAIASDSSLASIAVGGAPPPPPPSSRHFGAASPRPDRGPSAVVFSLTLPSDEDSSLPHFVDIEDESAAMTRDGSKLYEEDCEDEEEVGASSALTVTQSSSSVGQ